MKKAIHILACILMLSFFIGLMIPLWSDLWIKFGLLNEDNIEQYTFIPIKIGITVFIILFFLIMADLTLSNDKN